MAHDQPSLEVVPPPVAPPQDSPYEPCDTCGNPLDERQRYCVSCGGRRRHSHDPAARFLAEATRHRRTRVLAAATPSARRRGATSAATAALIAVIPAALGAGVLIGRSSGGGDGKLIAALRAEKAPVIAYSGAGTGAATSASTGVPSTGVTPPASTFKLAHGYAVELGTLGVGTSQSAAARTEQADRSKGAGAVGVIAQSDFSVSPRPPAGDYVIYAGSYTTRAAAEAALAKLKGKFAGARVIAVSRSRGSSAGGAGKVVSRTRFGAAHQVGTGAPSQQQLSQGSQVANQDSHSTGKAASGAGLPDVVVVP
jgi:hypothetical protein